MARIAGRIDRRLPRLVVVVLAYVVVVVVVRDGGRRPRTTTVRAFQPPRGTTTSVRRGFLRRSPSTVATAPSFSDVGPTAAASSAAAALPTPASPPPPPTFRRASAASATAGEDASSSEDDVDGVVADDAVADRPPPPPPFRPEDVRWKLRPPPETPIAKKVAARVASNLMRLRCLLKGERPPFVLCPKGGKAVLEAYHKGSGRRWNKIGKFGLTTVRGPPHPLVDETVRELYDPPGFVGNAGAGAIVYMFVEPEHRGNNLGDLALETIGAIHAFQNCDFTLLVADDDGSGKLVTWYETRGFRKAPKLQDMMGSPGGKYGVSMIAPTTSSSSELEECNVQWW